MEDARQFLAGINPDVVEAEAHGEFASAFIRATTWIRTCNAPVNRFIAAICH
jgi:hypothetical protein